MSVVVSRIETFRWITNRNFDMLLFIAACLSSYLMIYLHVAVGVPAMLLWWFWIISVDGPHVFATLSRTFLDRQEWHQRSRLFWFSLIWFLPGPASILLSLASGSRLPFFLFKAFASLWAYWHVVRQHYGFLVLYQKKNGEPAGKNNAIDYWCFYILMIAPFLSFILRHPEARETLGLSQAGSPEQILLPFIHISIAGALIAYIVKEIVRTKQGNPWNLPKNLFLTACIPLHLVIFLHPYISTHLDLILFVVFVTFYHNIQYLGIVWFYNRNRYRDDPEGKEFGPAGKISKNFLIYYGVAILFTLIYRYTNWFFLGASVPLLSGPNAISGANLGSLFHVSDLAYAFWWGFALHHYYLDQKIWRVSKDQQLNRELKLS